MMKEPRMLKASTVRFIPYWAGASLSASEEPPSGA